MDSGVNGGKKESERLRYVGKSVRSCSSPETDAGGVRGDSCLWGMPQSGGAK
jgi:hypothetical protein